LADSSKRKKRMIRSTFFSELWERIALLLRAPAGAGALPLVGSQTANSGYLVRLCRRQKLRELYKRSVFSASPK
jgi:hypothetical protein